MEKLNSGAEVQLFPSAIVVFNFSDGDDADGKLAQIISGHPGEAVVFINTRFARTVFSQAENHNRAFIFSRDAIDPATVDPTYPAQWVSDGDFLPGLPGNLTLTATDGGFRVSSLAPDPTETHFFS